MRHPGYTVILLWIIAGTSILLVGCTSRATFTQAPVSTPSPESDKPSAVSDWDRTVAVARKERKVFLYAAYGLSPSRDAMIEALKQKYGIELELLVLRGNELAAKVLNERRAGIYAVDVYMGGSGTPLTQLIPAGVLDPIEPMLLLPEVKDPSAWIGGLSILDKSGYLFSTMAELSTRIVFNTRLMKPSEIRSFKDLLDPKWKEKILMDDPRATGGGIGVFHLATKVHGEDFFRQFFLKQKPSITRDARQLVEWVALGKYTVGIGASNAQFEAFASAGAPIDQVSRLEDATEIRSSAGIVAAVNNSPHPNAQKVLINWILSKEGQTLISKSQGIASRRLDVPTSHLVPSQLVNPREKYIIETEEYLLERPTKMVELAKRIMAEAGY